MLIMFLIKKKKEIHKKKQLTHSPLQCQRPVQSLKFKSILKKRKREDISDIPNQKKKGTFTKKLTHLNVKIQVEVQDRS
jgi:hypothetical protein